MYAKAGMSPATNALNVGAVGPAEVGPARTVFTTCVLSENVSAGVVVAVATEVVNSGLSVLQPAKARNCACTAW